MGSKKTRLLDTPSVSLPLTDDRFIDNNEIRYACTIYHFTCFNPVPICEFVRKGRAELRFLVQITHKIRKIVRRYMVCYAHFRHAPIGNSVCGRFKNR